MQATLYENMVGKPMLMMLIVAVGVAAIAIAGIYTYPSIPPLSQASDDILPRQERQDNRTIMPQKSYSHTIWAQTGSTGNGTSVSTTLMLTMCALRDVQQFSEVAGADKDNPIVLRKNGEEAKVEFCATSHDREAITWYLVASDADVMYSFLPDYEGALAQGVNVTLDKAFLQMPAYTWNTTVSEDPDPPNSGQFTAYISADEDTKPGANRFHVLAVRHIDNQTAQVQNHRVHINVVE